MDLSNLLAVLVFDVSIIMAFISQIALYLYYRECLIRFLTLIAFLEQMFKYTRTLQLTIFQGTSLLEKEVVPAAD